MLPQKTVHCGKLTPAMSALGQLRRTNAAYAFAGCPLCLQKRTNTRTSRGVRFVPKPDSCAGANSTTRPRLRFRSHDRACISGLLCGAFREQAGRAPFSQTRRNRLPPRVGRENSRSPRSSASAVPPPVDDAAHRFFDGCNHLLDRHVAVGLRHGPVASLLRANAKRL